VFFLGEVFLSRSASITRSALEGGVQMKNSGRRSSLLLRAQLERLEARVPMVELRRCELGPGALGSWQI
jgi:hypothetical protein